MLLLLWDKFSSKVQKLRTNSRHKEHTLQGNGLLHEQAGLHNREQECPPMVLLGSAVLEF